MAKAAKPEESPEIIIDKAMLAQRLETINQQKHQVVAQLNMLEGAARAIQELLASLDVSPEGEEAEEDKPNVYSAQESLLPGSVPHLMDPSRHVHRCFRRLSLPGNPQYH